MNAFPCLQESKQNGAKVRRCSASVGQAEMVVITSQLMQCHFVTAQKQDPKASMGKSQLDHNSLPIQRILVACRQVFLLATIHQLVDHRS